jgi:hypothetical protein
MVVDMAIYSVFYFTAGLAIFSTRIVGSHNSVFKKGHCANAKKQAR